MTEQPEYLFKIMTTERWAISRQENKLILDSAADHDFIHLAEEGQVERIASKFFGAQTIVVLKIDPKRLPGQLVYESNPGGVSKYWHLYNGSIPMEAVVGVGSNS